MKKLAIEKLFLIRSLIVVLCAVCGVVPAWGDNDAQIEYPNGTIESGAWTTILPKAKAQDGCTVTLLRDVNVTTDMNANNSRVFTRNTTLDLNGHILSGTVTGNLPLVYMNGSGKTLTINDSQGSGRIRATGNADANLYCIHVNDGHVILNSGTVEITNTNTSGTSTSRLYAVGVYVKSGMRFTMHSGSVSANAKMNAYAVWSKGTTTIDGGTFTATASSKYAYGLYSGAGKITATGAIITASSSSLAYGAQAKGTVSDSGVEEVGELELNNCTLKATATTGGEAYGVHCTGEQKTVSGTPHVVCSNATINGGSITATAKTLGACAVYSTNTIISTDGQKKSNAELTIRNATLHAETETSSSVYGIRAGSTTTVDGCSITALSGTSTAAGVIAYDGAISVNNSTITATAATNDAYGICASGAVSDNGVKREAVVTLDNNTVSATAATEKAYALFATGRTGGPYNTGYMAVAGKITVNGGIYDGQAGTTGYAALIDTIWRKNEAVAIPSIIINDGKFKGTEADISKNGETGYFVINGGYYSKGENIDTKLGDGMNKVAVKSGSPEYTAGYRYRVTSDMTGEVVCKVYQGASTLVDSFSSLEEALTYVNQPENSSTALTIVMCGNYTLSKGDYVLPSNKTLLVPYKASGTGKGATQAAGTDPAHVNHNTTYISPTPLYKLTFASGVNMTVKSGAVIEASSVLYITNGSNGSDLYVNGTGIVHDTYGWIELEQGVHVDLESGAKLYAWGYITGKGEINAKSGSEVYEDFQMGDWHGGNVALEVQGNTNGLANKGVFLITHYYYQNIECPITYRAGSKAYGKGGTAGDLVSSTINAVTNPCVQFIGTDGNSMFLMDEATAGEDTWVRKEYDPETDYTNWFLNSGANIGNFTLKMSSYIMDVDVNTSDYVLPITSNFNIIANYGDVKIENDVCFIPGSRLTIKKEANVIIPSDVRVYFYDQDDWSAYSTKGYWFCPGFSPSWTTNPRLIIGDKKTTKMPDAEVLVEGKLTLRGAAYTTAGGANIHSTRENAGKISFDTPAPASTDAIADFSGKSATHSTLCQLTYSETTGTIFKTYIPHYEGKALNSVWLKNEDGSYSETAGTEGGRNWIYTEENGEYRWVLSYDDGCFTYKNNGSGEHQYIHPSDWVAVEANSNGDHAYHSEDGTRMFINAQADIDDAYCVWWEVDPTPEIIDGTTYYMANNSYFDNYGTYFYWCTHGTWGCWEPKKVTVIWNDKDGNPITNGTFGDVYNFNTSPQFYGTAPTWANTSTEKHEWIGWRDAEGNIYDKNATLPRATADITYTAYFVTSKYQSTITFKNDDNTLVWVGLVDYGEVPVCPVTPTKASTVSTDYTFTGWNTPPVAVTGAATYIAQYSESTRRYTVTFYNYDAQTILNSIEVDYNARPIYAGVTPFRPNTSAYSYAWTGWQQGVTRYDTSDELAMVTGNTFYIATFEQTELKYQVFFKRQDGSIIDAPLFNYEETPAAFPVNPTMASTVSTDYIFSGWDPAELQPVTEDGMTYTAQFSESPRQYTAHFVNYNGATLADVTIDYNSVPVYADETPFKPNDNRNSFEFSGWSWDGGNAGLEEALPAIQSDMTFIAQFNPVLLQFNVIYQREDGSVIDWQKKKYEEETVAPSVSDYHDELYNYTFTGWTPTVIVNPVTADATYTAHFDQTIRMYEVTFDVQGHGIAPDAQTVTYNALVTQPANPTAEHYIFGGWYKESECTNAWDFGTDHVTDGTTLYAKWTPLVASVTTDSGTEYYTTFDAAWSAVNGATSASTLKLLQNVTNDSYVTYQNNKKKECTLDLNGYTMSSSSGLAVIVMSKSGTTLTIDDSSEGETGRLYIARTDNSNTYGVYINSGTLQLEAGNIEVHAKASSSGHGGVYAATANATFFTMNGGHIVVENTASEAHGLYNKGTMTINGGTIRARSTNNKGYGVRWVDGTVTVNNGKFHVTGKTDADASIAKSTSTTVTTPVLVLQGGYYNNAIESGLATYCATNYHVFPNAEEDYPHKVAEGYMVTFNANGHGSAPEAQLIEKNTYATTPVAPSEIGYTFGGWYKEAACTNEWDFASDEVIQATALYAKWTPNTNTPYVVKHYQQNLDGSYPSEPTETDNETGMTDTEVTPPVKSYTGFTAPDAQTVTILADGSRVVTYNYTRNSYNLTWNANGGELSGSYTSGLVLFGAPITAPTVTRTNYDFDGWNETPAAIMPAEDKTYTAQWTLRAVASVTVNEVTNYYTTFDAAWNAANTATAVSTIQLLQDVAIPSYATYQNSHNQNCTLDLNGHTLTGSGQAVLHSNKAGTTFTLTDRSTDHNGKILANPTSSVASYGVYVQAGTFVLEEGTIEGQFNKNTLQGVRVGASGSFKMDGGTIHIETTNGKEADGVYANGTTIINGGTIDVKAAGNGYGIYYNNGTTTVNGGNFNITASGSAYVTNQVSANANIVISGGYYNIDTQLGTCVTSPCRVHELPDWHEAYETGYRYEVIPGAASVTIHGETNYYNTFNLAFTAANGSTTYPATITLLEDATISSYVTYNNTNNQNCTLDLNGYTLTASSGITVILINNRYITFSVTDSSKSRTGKVYIARTGNNNTYGMYVQNGNFQLEAGTIEVHTESTSKGHGAVHLDGTRPSFTMNGGKIYVENTASTFYAIGVRASNTSNNTTMTINNGTIQVVAAQQAYGVYWLSGGTATVNGGQFHITGESGASIAADGAHLVLQGGYYNTNTNLSDYVVSPYSVKELADTHEKYAEGYRYMVTQQEENLVITDERTITHNTEAVTTTVHTSGSLTIQTGSTLTTTDLILEATPESSGELIGDVEVTNAYFDLSQPGGFKARTWYAIAVPWQVDVPAYNKANNGVYTKKGEDNYVQQELGRTFDLIYYDGYRRSQGENQAWNYVEDDDAAEHIMDPGRAYMIYMTSDADIIRFEKSTSAALHTGEVDVVKHPSTIDENLADWNGIANPATYKAYLDVGTTENWGQVYDAETKSYSSFKLTEQQLQVGQPVFVQPIEAKTVVAEREEPSAGLAPRRTKESRSPLIRHEVVLARSDGEEADRIIVRMDEDKEANEYVVGQDLAKMGVSAVVPQMWINQYDSRLCINTAIPMNNKADYPLSLFAPIAGEYTISVDPMTNSSMLYLTYDNRIIWNLTYAPYSLSLETGTNMHYGLRIVKTPTITTGIEDTTVQNAEAIRKVIVDEKVYIIRNGEMYSITGQKTK